LPQFPAQFTQASPNLQGEVETFPVLALIFTRTRYVPQFRPDTDAAAALGSIVVLLLIRISAVDVSLEVYCVGQLQTIGVLPSSYPDSIRTTFNTCEICTGDASGDPFAQKSDVRHSDPVREKVPPIRAFVTALVAFGGIHLLVSGIACISLTSKLSTIRVPHLSFRTKPTNIAVAQQIPPKRIILATEIRIPIRNQKPRNQSTGHSERGSDQEGPLQCLTLGRKGFLDGDENLRTDGRSRFPYRGCKAEEMAAKWCGKRFGAAEESSDLRQNVS
jgi:hypothetical protein